MRKNVDAPIVLTRYLYIKDDVWTSLLMAILTKDIEQTLFWTCEMYHSGFETELADYLLAVYTEFFKAKNPRLEKYLCEWSNVILDGPHIAATMARNLVSSPRLFTVKDFETTNDENMVIKMKSIRELSEKDLRDRVEQMKTELSKLQTENAKGTLRKETGKIRKVRKEVARLLTRLNEVKKE